MTSLEWTYMNLNLIVESQNLAGSKMRNERFPNKWGHLIQRFLKFLLNLEKLKKALTLGVKEANAGVGVLREPALTPGVENSQ